MEAAFHCTGNRQEIRHPSRSLIMTRWRPGDNCIDILPSPDDRNFLLRQARAKRSREWVWIGANARGYGNLSLFLSPAPRKKAREQLCVGALG